MDDITNRVIFHIDANSAFLSWEAAHRLQNGESLDLREIPSVIGGDPKTRHGIVLAKSIPAKSYGIQTGEPIFSAVKKCPNLTMVPPNYNLYIKCSNAMVDILKEYSPMVQRYSVDECFLDFTNMDKLYGSSVNAAEEIKERIKRELGFTVNIGISNNKLLAKMASDFKKPDMLHTLFPWEIKEKMWPLPVEDLFMVGRATAPKLHRLNIYTIGDLANYDIEIIKWKLKSYGNLIWRYANGIDNSTVRKSNYIGMKGMGNSTTLPFDVTDRETAYLILISLAENVGMRLRDSQNLCQLVSITIKNSSFQSYSKQQKLFFSTDSTNKIIESAKRLFDELWKGEPIRHLGLAVSDFCTGEAYQLSVFEVKEEESRALDKTIDSIRLKYGSKALVRSVFIHSGIKGMSGGVGVEEYPVMSSIL